MLYPPPTRVGIISLSAVRSPVENYQIFRMNIHTSNIKGAKDLSSSTPQMEAARWHIQKGGKVSIYL